MPTRLLVYGAALFILTFAVGICPMFVKWRRSSVHKMSVVSSGVLIGAALYIVIPEGAGTIFTNAIDQIKEGEIVDVHSLVQQFAAALLSGFIVMYFVETLHEPPKPRPDAENPKPEQERHPNSTPLVLGLVMHSLADGLSLGASSFSSSGSSSGIDFVVFLAIILHKGPTAFALGTLLLHDDTCYQSLRLKAMLVFSAAAPLAAVATSFLLQVLSNPAAVVDGTVSHWTGLCLTFSGGTFLFVATHVTGYAVSQGETYQLEENERLHEHECDLNLDHTSPLVTPRDYDRRDIGFLGRLAHNLTKLASSRSSLVVIGMLIPPLVVSFF